MTREKVLKVLLVLLGLLFSAAIYPIIMSLWHADLPGYPDDMMLSLYFTLGILLLIAARNPPEHRSLIAFAAWSSFAHATVMVVQAYQTPAVRDQLTGSAILAVIGISLLALAPAKTSVAR